MFFKRDIASIIERYKKFPVIAILGPRQSGKTTLVREIFKNYIYVNLENPEIREYAKSDPNRFLRKYENLHGLIIDEFQYVPELLSYIQIQADEKRRPGYFVITGSQNFLMNQAITQSLAGRVGILTLLPLSLHELKSNNLISEIDQAIFNGSYPRLYHEEILPIDMYPSYIQTYIERDVRQIEHIGDILIFQKFMRLCAARIGQELNISEISTQAGVDQRTIKNWISILESSYILFLLKPYHNNFNKRLVKSPKLYFYDTGLACSLLDIKTLESLSLSSYRGPLFECLMVSDFYKQFYNQALSPALYFWRDANGRIEVDCLIDTGDKVIAIELKSGETIQPIYFKGLLEWNKISASKSEDNFVIYGGKLDQERNSGRIFSWLDSTDFVKNLYRK